MTLAFPRVMPACMTVSQSFEIDRVDYMAPENRGLVGGVTAGWPLWSGRWSMAPQGPDQRDEVRAWISAQRGPQRLFVGRDMSRTRPRSLRNGTGGLMRAGVPGGPVAWDASGTAESWSVNSTRDVLTMYQFPAGVTLALGDYVGFLWSTDRAALVRVTEAGTAAVNGVITVSVEPTVPTIVPSNATAYVIDPYCLMKLTPETSFGDLDLLRFARPTIAGLQVLLP